MENVVIGYDGSTCTDTAVEVVSSLAWGADASVLITARPATPAEVGTGSPSSQGARIRRLEPDPVAVKLIYVLLLGAVWASTT